MHFPFNLKIGVVEIPSHFIFEVLAYSIGFRYFLYLRKKNIDLISSENRIIIFIGAAIGALVFSRLIGIFESPDIINRPLNLLILLGNKTIVGGLLGGLAGVEITKKIIGVKISSGDLMVYPLILAIGIGRIGCFLAGLEDNTYGIPSGLPWAMDLGDGIKRHPTNLYEIFFLILLFISLKLFESRRMFSNGSRFKVFMIAYLFFRLGIEFIKPSHKYFFNLSLIQLSCIAGLIYYCTIFFQSRLILEKNSDG
jgi:phosphatidylglycerol:prolipoprotein diacylglycerol transferase